MDYIKLSKEISYALRHNPEKYNLKLDKEGFIDINILLKALNDLKKYPRNITKEDLEYIIKNTDKVRHEIKNNKIRALYGHSIKTKIKMKEIVPPKILYHGTTHIAIKEIKKKGLLPMGRQYVHLSKGIDVAIKVGNRKDDNPVILEIDCINAYKDGIKFYQGNDDIVLADKIPPKYISVQK